MGIFFHPGWDFDILPWDRILIACPVPEHPGTATGQNGKNPLKSTIFEKKRLDNF
jgi:hypothetical protein